MATGVVQKPAHYDAGFLFDLTLFFTKKNIMARQNLAGLFTANKAGIFGFFQALMSRGFAEKFKFAGFDVCLNKPTALQKETTQALILQNLYPMSYVGVKLI